ncbi:MAG: potassium transporter TrkG [Clostridia bacterium]|nr:potassium transporter TrkG [Clostridia bacterium]
MRHIQGMKTKLSSFQIIVFGFLGMILCGTILLMLPMASGAGVATPLPKALFTATSAVCVTGLVLVDTASYWSLFGQSIILLLIQIGGMGVITVAAAIAMLSGRKISLMQRSTIQEAIAAPKVGGIVRLTGFVIKTSFCIEFLGAMCMAPSYVRVNGLRGIWMAVFHSVSAFCNAGFDIAGSENAPFSSLTAYGNDIVVNIVIMLLIVIGGIGFLTWDDIHMHGIHVQKYRMQSKVILVVTLVLILFPATYFFFCEFSDMPLKNRLLFSFFQAITPRTAGFNTADLTAISSIGQAILIFLMLIGGSPGSTAGGMKTTTVAVLFSNAVAVFKRKESPSFFGRSIECRTVKIAATILVLYLTLFFMGGIFISGIEGLPLGACLFETASAVGTVGLTLGITPILGVASQGILIVLMFLGRVGGLTLIYAAVSVSPKTISKLPHEKITVG